MEITKLEGAPVTSMYSVWEGFVEFDETIQVNINLQESKKTGKIYLSYPRQKKGDKWENAVRITKELDYKVYKQAMSLFQGSTKKAPTKNDELPF